MDRSIIDMRWPNALRWFLAQGLHRFAPWHLIQLPSAGASAANAFRKEDIHHREVFVFAWRQDCDDFAGIEIVEGRFTDKVIYFHPSFASSAATEPPEEKWNIVCDVFDDAFEFFARQVIPDMKDWALTVDASDLT